MKIMSCDQKSLGCGRNDFSSMTTAAASIEIPVRSLSRGLSIPLLKFFKLFKNFLHYRFVPKSAADLKFTHQGNHGNRGLGVRKKYVLL